MSRSKPRVLIVGVNTNYGGVETVVSRLIGRLCDDFAFDTISSNPFKQAQFAAGGNKVIFMPRRQEHPFRYDRVARSFFESKSKDYQALWYNSSSFSNINPLKYAAQYGIPVRICHSHVVKPNGGIANKVLHSMHRKKIPSLTTLNLACSQEAGSFAFGNAPFTVLTNAFDIEEFAFDRDTRMSVRSELGVSGKFAIGLVGRLAPEKNQLFLVELMPEILKRRPDAVLVLIGEGRLRQELEQRIAALGLTGSVTLIGARADIHRTLSALDVFAFPSLHEGLGLAAVEAQANGLPVVMSDTVPELAVASMSVQRVSLEDPNVWVEALLGASREKFISDKRLIDRFDLNKTSDLFAGYLMGEVPSFYRDGEV